MKRRFYPSSRGDRISFWFLVASVVAVPAYIWLGKYVLAGIWGFNLVLFIVNTYVLQEEPPEPRVDEYSTMIDQIRRIETTLSRLNEFLQREQKRIAATESTLAELESEKTRLEPVVATQRETVEAILAAHSAKMAPRAWKERIIGLILGVFASLIAAMLYALLKQ